MPGSSSIHHKKAITDKALELGFAAIGFSRAEKMEEEARLLEKWLNANQHGQMHYMANHFEKRTDPTLLVPGAKTVISLLYNYYPEQQQPEDTYKISKYAYGKDYHYIIKHKLKSLFFFMQEQVGAVEGRVFVDSAPVLERDWARRSGLGWIGRNAMLIHPGAGSFFFLSELIVDLELPPDGPIKNYCGTCTRCIEACPTGAISGSAPHVDGSKCISYFTIELREAIPLDYKGKFDDWIFGCDVCQDVCPWNRFSTPHGEPDFLPHHSLLEMTKEDWQQLEEETFRQVFKKSAVKRTKYTGLRRNIDFVTP